MLLTDALAQFQVQLEADGRSPHTRAQYGRHINLLASWAASAGLSGHLADLGHADIARFLASPVARTRADGAPKTATTLNALRSSIRSFFAYARDAGWVADNPARLLRRARTGTAPPRGLTDAEEERLLAVLDAVKMTEEKRDAVLFRLLLRAGLRLGAALGLDAGDVDLVEGTARIHTKGDRIEQVFLPLAVRAELSELIGDRSGPVFANQRGERLSSRHVQRRFARIRERAGLPGSVTPHSLRHRFATKLLERTGDLRLVQRALTHRSVSSTAVYASVGDERLRAAVGA